MTLSLSFAYLYPDSMNIYGDRGNIITLMKRCQFHRIQSSLTEIKINQKFDYRHFDFFFAGGGQDQSQLSISQDLHQKKDQLTKAVTENKVFLLICGSYQLFGHYFQTSISKINGIKILDIYTKAGKKRKIGNIISQINPQLSNQPFFKSKLKTLVGFENHSGNTYFLPNSNAKPLATTISGFGNNDQKKFEGTYYKNCFGTYMHGSFLPKNPHFADYLIYLALQTKYQKDIPLKPIDDSLEITAHNFILKNRR